MTRPQPHFPWPVGGAREEALPLFASVFVGGVGQCHPQGDRQSPWALELQLQACPDLRVPPPQRFTPKPVLTSSLSPEGGQGVGEREERLGPWGCVMGRVGTRDGQVGTCGDPHPALGGGGPGGSGLRVTLTPPSCAPELIACGRERWGVRAPARQPYTQWGQESTNPPPTPTSFRATSWNSPGRWGGVGSKRRKCARNVPAGLELLQLSPREGGSGQHRWPPEPPVIFNSAPSASGPSAHKMLPPGRAWP